MNRLARRTAPQLLGAALLLALPSSTLGQTPPPTGKPGAARHARRGGARPSRPRPAETRVRLVLDAVLPALEPGYSSVSTPTAYAEPSYDPHQLRGGLRLRPRRGALQVSLYRGFGLLAGYSQVTRDVTGTVDVSRPHPLLPEPPAHGFGGAVRLRLQRGRHRPRSRLRAERGQPRLGAVRRGHAVQRRSRPARRADLRRADTRTTS